VSPGWRSSSRRRFLRLSAGLPLGLAGWASSGCGAGAGSPAAPRAGGASRSPTTPLGDPIVAPKVNGAINVQPLRCLGCAPVDETIEPGLVALQLSSVYSLGFDGIRITAPLGDRNSFLAAIPYARAARALGIDALVLLADFSGLTLARALHDDRRRAEILAMYAGIFAPAPAPVRPGLGGLGPGGAGRIAFQVLNEPVGFVGVPPDVYVREILAPCRQDLRDVAPEVIVVAAAEAGNKAGPPRMRAMLEAGLETVCDRIAYHVYSREIIPMLSDNVKQIVWVTESGSAGTSGHLAWVRDVFPEIRAQIGDVLRIFYFDLFDPQRGVYRVIDVAREGDAYRAVVESTALHEYWSARVAEAAAGRPVVAFDTLVPDVRLYFPTAEDVAAFDGAPRE
jgi:hypothetical protein